ncbi:hypothetical protein MN086_08390 [Sulfurovum sp. XGS-02]|uniref:DUF2231 domain-containing protein n=1 Tax=Sulfurovum sp. XGS-02 TaxID=2925411 RepID=UPI0020652C67|nr:DUF2231 domain-containing protein [Sulfurovum sp. XGS-02]UPT77066.1 hypothetical protein MN086_08390 [Sulfurovum sp. XGS-02]
MQLPTITLPKIELPFDIPVLWHPVVDHFVIALPVVILLLELVNLVMRKKAISGMSLFLILLTVVAAVGAYFTGLVDGKEAYPALNDVAKEALAAHKNLGTYLMLASGVILLFKLISMLTEKSVIRAIYIVILIAFVAGIFEQGEEGGELVYKHGLNVEQVKVLDDELFDVQEELDETTEELEEMKSSAEAKSEETVETNTTQTEAKTAVETTPVETITESVKTEVQKEAEPLQVEGMPEEMVQPEIATH